MINDFIFDGQALSDFGYILAFENREDVISVSDMQYNTIKAALSDISYRVSHSYENNYSSTYLIIKNTCDVDDDWTMTDEEISELTRWLARKQYKWFRFVDDEEYDEVWYKVQIKVQKEYAGGSVIGLQLTITANAPFGFTREFEYNIDNSEYVMNAISDEEGYIYPDCVITVNTGGTIKLTGAVETVIQNCAAGEVLTLNGETLQISSSLDHDFTADFNYVFPRLAVEYGNTKNTLVKDGDYDLNLKYRGIRKVGFK